MTGREGMGIGKGGREGAKGKRDGECIYESIYLVNGMRQGSAIYGPLLWGHIQTMACFCIT